MPLLTALSLACGDETPASILLSDVAGAYQATTFERETTDGTIDDQLALGASITLNLASDGSTTGRLFVPAPDTTTTDFDADLAGTWSLNGPLVRLQHATNTFLVDIGFLFANDQLMGERTTALETIRVVFVR